MNNSNSLPENFKDLCLSVENSQDVVFQEIPPKEKDKINLQATEEVSTIVSQKTRTRRTSGISQGSMIEERKEPQRRAFAQRRKIVDSETERALKQMKLDLNSQQPQSLTNFKVQRRYSTETKLKVLEFSEKLGPKIVAKETGIPETSIRRWKKIGIENSGKSGRKPLFPSVEKELMKCFWLLELIGS